MDDETEVIKQQMAHTRESLAEKVEALENKVIGTVEGATQKVASTVESVSDTVASVKDTVQETVANVRDTVTGTVDSVKESFVETVETVRDVFDISGHVERHPWSMVAGSIALGFIGGYLLTPPRRDPRDDRWPDMRGGPHLRDAIPDWFNRSAALPPQAGIQPAPQREESAESGWFSELAERFQPAIDRLKEVAITAGTSLIADMVLKSVPPQFKGDVSGVIDQFTTALGGKPQPPAAGLSPPSPAPPASKPGAVNESDQGRPHNRLSGTGKANRGNGRGSS